MTSEPRAEPAHLNPLGSYYTPEREQLQEMARAFAMREVLEVPAARWAAQRHDASEVEAIRVAFADLDEALHVEPRDYEQLQRLDAVFHQRIVQAAGNRLLEQSQGVLNELLVKGMQTTLAIEGRAEQSRDEHLRILSAVLENNSGEAARAAQTHVRNARRAANRRIAEASARLEPPD